MMIGMNVDNAGLTEFENNSGGVAAVDCVGENDVADNYSVMLMLL